MRRAALAAIFFVACASPSPTPSPTSSATSERAAIIGGTNDTGDPAVVAVFNQVIGVYCTATLVAPRVALTAGHCLELNADAVVFGDDATSATSGARVPIVAAQKHPKYTAEGADFDLGVVVLERAVTDVAPIAPSHAALDASLVGTNVRHVGFGTTVEGATTGSGTKHVVTTPIVSLEATRIVSGTATSNTCLGDSGGPAFVTVAGRELLAGVVSDGPDCHSPGWDDRLDVADVVAWLDPIVADDGASLAPPPPAPSASTSATQSSSSGCNLARVDENTYFSWLFVVTACCIRRARRPTTARRRATPASSSCRPSPSPSS